MQKKVSRKTIELIVSTFFFVLAGFFQYYDIYLPPVYAHTFSFLAKMLYLMNRIKSQKKRSIAMITSFLLIPF